MSRWFQGGLPVLARAMPLELPGPTLTLCQEQTMSSLTLKDLTPRDTSMIKGGRINLRVR